MVNFLQAGTREHWYAEGRKYGLDYLRHQYRKANFLRKATDLSPQEYQFVIGNLEAITQAAQRITVEQQQPEAKVEKRVTEDGMYRHPVSGVIYKVQWNKAEGDGRRLYAKKLVVVATAEYDEAGERIAAAKVKFVYAPGAVYRLNASMKMTKEQAKAFGALYGTCCRCGRTLTLEESIDRMMGRICYGKMGW